MVSLSTARQLVKKTSNKKYVPYEDWGVNEILKVIFLAGRLGSDFTGRLAAKLKGKTPYKSLKNIWRFVHSQIKYKEDNGKQWVQSPGQLVKTGTGDCKSMTIIITSLMTNLGIPWIFRVAFYDRQKPNLGHIYPVAFIDYKEVIVDAVHDRFDEEVKGAWKVMDYSPDGKLVASIGARPAQETSLFDLVAGSFFIYLLANTNTSNE